jgi:hypothetical protein
MSQITICCDFMRVGEIWVSSISGELTDIKICDSYWKRRNQSNIHYQCQRNEVPKIANSGAIYFRVISKSIADPKSQKPKIGLY